VARATNFGDPSFEPTDEELAELMHEAFAEVPAQNAEALARIHSEVARLREEAMTWLEQRRGAVK
jgi:predicted Zn-dependent protease with MMP-like domain